MLTVQRRRRPERRLRSRGGRSMRCYDRRQLSFGHFNAGYLLGRAAGERVDLTIRSRIGFALLPAFKAKPACSELGTIHRRAHERQVPGAGEGPTVGGPLRIDRRIIHASVRADTSYQSICSVRECKGACSTRASADCGLWRRASTQWEFQQTCAMTKLPGKLLQTDSMWMRVPRSWRKRRTSKN